jgi:hypothetical protein
MRYYEVSDALEAGKKIKIKQWDKAYWFMKDGVIINHDELGIEVPADCLDLLLWSLMCVAKGDWEVVKEDRPVKKLFISQPMKGKTDEEIIAVREEAIKRATELIKCDVEVIDSFFQEAPVEDKPLWYLAKSLELLAEADVAYFAEGWDEARGCKIEHECAVQYGIDRIEE